MAEDIPTYKPPKDLAGDKPPQGRGAKERKIPGGLAPDRAFKHTIPQLRKALEDEIGIVILGFSAAGDMHCAEVLADGSEKMIDGWLWLAEKHKGFRRVLEYTCGGGGYAMVANSTLAVLLPMMQHHGMYPEHWPTPGSLVGLFAMGAMNGNGNAASDHEPEAEATD